MKLVSWNVNGLRACVTKGFTDYFKETNADIFCIQETKLQDGQITLQLGEEYEYYWNYAVKKGYSGTAVITRIKPLLLEDRLEWEDRFRGYLQQLDKHKPVIVCGDLNVAHQEIDIKNAKPNRGNSGFTDEERDKMTLLLGAGFIDTFRHLYPERTDVYSWWSNMPGVRERNVGWRIDYFLASSRLAPSILDARIDCEIRGSDHCPVILEVVDI